MYPGGLINIPNKVVSTYSLEKNPSHCDSAYATKHLHKSTRGYMFVLVSTESHRDVSNVTEATG